MLLNKSFRLFDLSLPSLYYYDAVESFSINPEKNASVDAMITSDHGTRRKRPFQCSSRNGSGRLAGSHWGISPRLISWRRLRSFVRRRGRSQRYLWRSCLFQHVPDECSNELPSSKPAWKRPNNPWILARFRSLYMSEIFDPLSAIILIIHLLSSRKALFLVFPEWNGEISMVVSGYYSMGVDTG